ncbi:MAG: YrhA family protein [Proteiniphilum sp.]|nr:YrhA family protein [Proteiniphilum sp.]
MDNFYGRIILLDGAMIVRPVTAEDIKWANDELKKSHLPSIPIGYANFLAHCNGFAFNGVELYGTDVVTDPQTNFQLIDMVSFSEQKAEYFNDPLLYFGRVDDDIFTYDPTVEKYETRDICSFEIWDEYSSFEEFLEKEISDKFLPTDENRAISYMVHKKMKEDPVFAKRIVDYYTLMADGGNVEAQYQLAMLQMYESDDEEDECDDDGRYDAWV